MWRCLWVVLQSTWRIWYLYICSFELHDHHKLHYCRHSEHRYWLKYAKLLLWSSNILTGILLNVYILTWCDTVSFIFNKTKTHALKVITQNLANLKEFGEDASVGIGKAIDDTRFLFKYLYGRPDVRDRDLIWAHLFALVANDFWFLPPTEDAFEQHVLWTCMQIIVSKSSHLSVPNYPQPEQYWRYILNGSLVPILMCKPTRWVIVKKVVNCKCKQGRCLLM